MLHGIAFEMKLDWIEFVDIHETVNMKFSQVFKIFMNSRNSQVVAVFKL